MIKKIALITCLTLIVVMAFNVQFILAQAPSDPINQGASSDGMPKLVDPLGNRSLPDIIGEGIKVALGVIGAIALALFVYGGFIWMTAAGNTARVQKGREVLVWATIGLIVIFTSYALLNFVLGAITGSG